MEKKKKKSTLEKLFLANALALAALLAAVLVTLWALGLLDSVFAFLF